MKYFVQIEIQVVNAESPEDAAQTVFDALRNDELSMTVGTMSGPQMETEVCTLELD